MRIAIVGAMDDEISFLKQKMEEEPFGVISKVLNKFVFYFGKIKNTEIVLVKSGVGRVNSAILISTLFLNFRNIDKVINIGIAGGYNTKLFDVIVGDKFIYGDVDLRGVGYKYGQMSGESEYYTLDSDFLTYLVLNQMNFHLGSICTREKFSTDKDEIDKLVNEHFFDKNILAFDMESAAYAQACKFYNIPFTAIRVISDIIGDNNQMTEYKNKNRIEACNKSSNFIYQLLLKI